MKRRVAERSRSSTTGIPSSIPLVVGLVLLAACAADPPTSHEPVVAELITMLEASPGLRATLAGAIDSAGVEGIGDLESFYGYVDDLVTWIPVEREATPKVLTFHYIINQAPDDALNEHPGFSDWMGRVAAAWGAFLDTPASAVGIESFASLPEYAVDDYFVGPSGWQTFNQFFAREIRPGKRPIADPRDDAVIVSPADAIFMGAWPIDERSTITVKDVEWRIADLLDDSPYADAFGNGIYTHGFLRITDYHRFHVPVGGVVREVRNVHGRVYLDVVRNQDGSLGAANGDSYQFDQERGLVIIESPTVGLVAVVPVGMTLISSVVLTPEVGARLRKGDLLGYFQFGGSDIVLLFQDRGVVLEAEVGTKYLQGQRIGRVEPAAGS
jgi:phosphatidylserine decarboxylase